MAQKIADEYILAEYTQWVGLVDAFKRHLVVTGMRLEDFQTTLEIYFSDLFAEETVGEAMELSKFGSCIDYAELTKQLNAVWKPELLQPAFKIALDEVDAVHNFDLRASGTIHVNYKLPTCKSQR